STLYRPARTTVLAARMAVAEALTFSAAVTVVVAVVSRVRISFTWYVILALLRCLANQCICCNASASAGSAACHGSPLSPVRFDLRTVALLAPRQLIRGLMAIPRKPGSIMASRPVLVLSGDGSVRPRASWPCHAWLRLVEKKFDRIAKLSV